MQIKQFKKAPKKKKMKKIKSIFMTLKLGPINATKGLPPQSLRATATRRHTV